ncbi:MAG: RsmD family RNA methyltransferase [Actinobacteria bacterium]|nr:RsmD family RNA methyltransferase [Actinomycetota bacterium]MCL5445724.1 RsmD family RNA methyltransferase [Actinomycetota bacterium]
MRIVGGTYRGRRLPARLPPGVRPTSDRVREAIFDILGSMGAIEGASVLDLFCGSGAMGIEAASRGASSVTFVDSDFRVVEAVRENLTSLGVSIPGGVLCRRLPEWICESSEFDVAFCDPPYDFDDWGTLLRDLKAGVAVLESNRPVDGPSNWSVGKTRRYGGTIVTVARSTSIRSRFFETVASQ